MSTSGNCRSRERVRDGEVECFGVPLVMGTACSFCLLERVGKIKELL